jgi:hypothetical protein
MIFSFACLIMRGSLFVLGFPNCFRYIKNLSINIAVQCALLAAVAAQLALFCYLLMALHHNSLTYSLENQAWKGFELELFLPLQKLGLQTSNLKFWLIEEFWYNFSVYPLMCFNI